jgi:outer membrane protein assembly factor BamD
MQFRQSIPTPASCLFAGCLALTLLSGCGRDPYDNPIANNSQQPDKILFDRSIRDLEKHRYEQSRLTLQTLINTYPDSEYIAKSKLAIADSWYREGTSHALAQAEAEYKDFITFFPTMEESAESQMKICQIHYDQMQSSDRDNTHALKADQECRQLLVQFPNSRFVDPTKQMLRDIQEVIADAEFRVGTFYTFKGSYRAGANRLQTVSEHYPLYSRNDEALWVLGNTYEKMGQQFSEQSLQAYAKLVRDYPLSGYIDQAKEKLVAANREIPDTDPDRYELMKYNLSLREDKSTMGKVFGLFGTGPNVRWAAKAGEPAMTALMPTTPPGITPTAAVQPSAEVTAETITGPSKLDTEPDARLNQGGGQNQPPSQPQTQTPQNQP